MLRSVMTRLVLSFVAVALITNTLIDNVQGARGSEKHTLYFLSILPYPDPEPSLNPSIADGPDLFPAVQLAVDHVNNRSDVLRDYHIELIQTDGGCNISSKALISLVSQLFHSDKQIVGIIGPSCSESAEAVGALSRRSEIALLSFHQGSSSLLVDRTDYPYSIGFAVSPNAYVAALIALAEFAQWTNVAAVYSDDVLVDRTQYFLFESEAEKKSINISFSSGVSEASIPYRQLRNSLSRVFIASVRSDVATKILCVAYHNGLLYPTYQWIFFNGYDLYESVEFYHASENRMYNCSLSEIYSALYGNVGVEFYSTASNEAVTVSGWTKQAVLDEYSYLWSDYNNSTSEEAPTWSQFVQLAYDSVWAMALALNGSLETLQEKNMSLNNYTYGQSNATEVILKHLYQLEFQGIYGSFAVNSFTGFIEQSAIYVFDDWIEFDLDEDAKDYLVSSDFESVVLRVANGVAVFFILVFIVTSILVAFVHILNTVYENYKSIKASSSRLNHFAYVGCYCFLLALLVYTIVEAFSTSPLATTVLCNFIPWLTSIGFSLVFGTVVVKTWRLYRLFISSKKHTRHAKKLVQDSFILLFVLLLVIVDVVFCTVWSSADPLRYENTSIVNVESKQQEVVEFCVSNYFTVWLILLAVYKGFLLFLAVFLAFHTRKIKMKEFKTTNISLLVYLLFLVTGLGIPVYFILWYLGVNVNISYTILCVLVIALVYLCWGLLFLPPVLPLLKEKIKPDVPVSKHPATTSTYVSN